MRIHRHPSEGAPGARATHSSHLRCIAQHPASHNLRATLVSASARTALLRPGAAQAVLCTASSPFRPIGSRAAGGIHSALKVSGWSAHPPQRRDSAAVARARRSDQRWSIERRRALAGPRATTPRNTRVPLRHPQATVFAALTLSVHPTSTRYRLQR